MNDRTSLGETKSELRRGIADRQRALSILEALTAPMPRSTSPASATDDPQTASRRGNIGVGRAAVDLLQRAARPMHGMTEIVPALQAAGYHVHPHGLATTLLRTGLVVRTGRGTFAAKPVADNLNGHEPDGG